jgi:hypothetical protein
MASFGNAFLVGLNSGRRNKLAQAEEARTQTNFDQRQKALSALQDQYGDTAYAPTETGQLQGIDQRKQLFPGQLEQQGITTEAARETLDSAKEARARQSAVIGNRYLDSIAKQAIADGQDPAEALLQFGNSLPPASRELLGINEASVGDWTTGLQQDPNFFANRAAALMDPAVQAKIQNAGGSKAAPKFGTGKVTLADGNTVRGEVVKNADGTVTLVGNPDARVAAFEPDAPFSPKDFGTSSIYTFGASGADPEAAANIRGGVQDRKTAERTGYQMGDFLGKRWSEDQSLSQTASNDVLSSLDAELQRGQNTLYSIDRAFANTSLGSAGVSTTWADLPASEANLLRGTLETVRSNAIIDQLTAIKKSGATLGQITEKELEVLATSVATLRQDLPPAELKKELRRYQENLEKTLGRARDNIERDIRRGRLDPADELVQRLFPDLAKQGAGTDRTDADILKAYGIED